MARIARVVVPGCPHHVTQRGNRRQQIFFQDEDYQLYRGLIAAAARKAGAEVWSYCFMPNHVHLVVTPSTEDGLRVTFAEAHRRYTGGDGETEARLDRAATIGRPLGAPEWIAELERRLGRPPAPRKRGRKPKADPHTAEQQRLFK